MADCPHFAFPFRFSSFGEVVVVEQDTDDELVACCAAIISYPLGFRPELPDFGVAQGDFVQDGPDLDEMRSAIRAYEPRADVQLDLTDDLLTGGIARVRAGVHAIAGG